MRTEDATQLTTAIQLAEMYHRGQVDKAGEPYIYHPLRVSQKCKTIDQKIIASLHDVLEDTNCTAEDLEEAGVSRLNIISIEAITKLPNENDDHYYYRVLHDKNAVCVKRYDLEDNMDTKRLPFLTDKDLKRLVKYHKRWRAIRSFAE